MQSVIAIVGRPNVGKSALFNRLAGRRIAIVHDEPGVTRDRVMAEVEWRGRPFTLIDTGGIGLLRGERATDVIAAAAFDQVQMALDAASVILLVVNVQDGVVPLDVEVAKRLRTAHKPVFVVVNKVDNDRADVGLPEFAQLGFEKLIPVSAIHGRGMENLMDEVLRHLPTTSDGEGPADADTTPTEQTEPPTPSATSAPLRLAIVGRPNVGKSSIINTLTNSQRVIVSPVPGTTRDSVDVPFEVTTEGRRERFVLVDTAGLRKARRVDDTVEYFSTERTRAAIEGADLVVLVLDAETGIVEQDKKIADLITEARRACLIVVNKWDLVADSVRLAQETEFARREQERVFGRPKRLVTLGEFGDWVREKLFFLDYAPVIFTSAKDGFQLDRLLEAVRYVGAQWRQKIPTAILNRTLADAIERRQPVSKLGHRLKFFYATQVKQCPPTLLLFVNRKEVFSPAYEKYLAGELRRVFGFEGCPIVLVPRERPKTIEPVRKSRPAGNSRERTRPDRNVDRGAKRGRGPGRPRRRAK
ncbi:MAG TPA: ribosome biogenesis GTPase Der [Verrucomicrobiota bacterium]|nr:ribosome biogenesis GTPase Der [Verrucomicrobiales bacterium]HRI13239.1 ribosome biogenesis GTPase Der [Verrucomicrobiota bacterium]